MSKAIKPANELQVMLEQIRAADETQAEAQLNIAAVLHAIKTNKLYKLAGYDSFSMMVRAELDFQPTTASAYCSLYESFTRWKYGKDEFCKMIRQLGSWRKVRKGLDGADKKLSLRAITKRLEELQNDAVVSPQLNVLCRTEDQVQRIEAALTDHGLLITESGRRSGVSDAFISLLDEYEELKKQVKPKAKPKARARRGLKRVA